MFDNANALPTRTVIRPMSVPIVRFRFPVMGELLFSELTELLVDFLGENRRLSGSTKGVVSPNISFAAVGGSSPSRVALQQQGVTKERRRNAKRRNAKSLVTRTRITAAALQSRRWRASNTHLRDEVRERERVPQRRRVLWQEESETSRATGGAALVVGGNRSHF